MEKEQKWIIAEVVVECPKCGSKYRIRLARSERKPLSGTFPVTLDVGACKECEKEPAPVLRLVQPSTKENRT